jgi:CRISPR system Cascade subunit CasA
MADGTGCELSLRDTLVRASEVREIYDDSPLVIAGLHRLLLAILHRNFGPQNFGEWQAVWRAGHFDAVTLDAYFARWRHRFDLFDAERPFYQVTEMEDAERHPAVLLKQEAATGNNATLFDHSFRGFPADLSPAEAASALVARQAYAIGGGVSRPFNFYGSTLTRGLSVLAFGNSLFETLMLNLLVYNKERPLPSEGEDLPAWEREEAARPQKEGTPVRGYLDYLTWQSRRVHLFPEGNATVVRWCQLQQNLKLPEGRNLLDPFKCYRVSETEGYQPLPLNPAKALWRDSHTLFQQAARPTERATKRPEVFNHLARVYLAREGGEIEASPTYGLATYGLATDPGKAASVLLWARERLPLPLRYLNDQSLVDELGDGLRVAQNVAEELRSATRLLARLILAPNSGAGGARQPDEGDVTDLARGFAADPSYWARLEPHFKRLLTELPRARDGDAGGGGEPLLAWAEALRRAAEEAFARATSGLDTSARSLKAVAQAESAFRRGLRQTLNAFKKRFETGDDGGGE